ncbi:twin-arginine translocase TatA/TatE family subunit [Ruania albidiflava]|uniref:twin-arginine translocase TatA/TatE family subunit n=1 Tax=Ruania albidiflava TaxID=366586 RepID=UPI0003B3CA6F|nr:twin-arginine translocase TatA/TatE family subunit [Ruania albidiflava]
MNGAEIIIILVLITIVVGPQRLPEYAEQLARLVRTLRDMARGATQTIKDELGPEAADLDFSKLDPRQYDPRRIVRDALMEDLSPTSKSAGSSRRSSSTKTSSSASGAGAVGAAAAGTAAAAASGQTSGAQDVAASAEDTPAIEEDPLAHGAPFDDEAT